MSADDARGSRMRVSDLRKAIDVFRVNYDAATRERSLSHVRLSISSRRALEESVAIVEELLGRAGTDPHLIAPAQKGLDDAKLYLERPELTFDDVSSSPVSSAASSPPSSSPHSSVRYALASNHTSPGRERSRGSISPTQSMLSTIRRDKEAAENEARLNQRIEENRLAELVAVAEQEAAAEIEAAEEDERIAAAKINSLKEKRRAEDAAREREREREAVEIAARRAEEEEAAVELEAITQRKRRQAAERAETIRRKARAEANLSSARMEEIRSSLRNDLEDLEEEMSNAQRTGVHPGVLQSRLNEYVTSAAARVQAGSAMPSPPLSRHIMSAPARVDGGVDHRPLNRNEGETGEVDASVLNPTESTRRRRDERMSRQLQQASASAGLPENRLVPETTAEDREERPASIRLSDNRPSSPTPSVQGSSSAVDQLFLLKLLKSRRPSQKFSGGDSDVDFEKHLRNFEGAVKIEGLTDELRLREMTQWFAGDAEKVVSRFSRREDASAAYSEAIDALKELWGLRHTTASEMLEQLLQGKPIPAGNVAATRSFLIELEDVHQLAVETDREDDFHRKSMQDEILAAKLPHWKFL